ncbi:MAG: 4-hydroxy-tetrahydrodipicolinate synthase, partial [Candidatus Thorarchaeota archaeon]
MGKRFVPNGVMPALVTPFTKDGDILEDGFKQVIDFTIDKGVTGVVPAGTTGEFSYLRTEERKKLLRLAIEFVDGRVPIIAGTGQNSTRATVTLTRYAADIGCDAALIISPYYLRPSDKGYFDHYAEVSRKADLPIIMYNIPQCTLGILNSNVVEDLADLDNIVGIKDSGGNIGHTVELIQKLKGKIPVLIGHDECFLSAIAAGASAAIMASANIIPHVWLKIMESVKAGDFEEAALLQQKAQTLARIVTRNGGAPPVKAALKMIGIKAGRSRMPLDTGGTLTLELKEEIRLE